MSSSVSGRHTRCAARASQPPANTESRANSSCSGSGSRRKDQSTAAARLRCRATGPGPSPSSPPPASRSATSTGLMARIRAAASSMPSGSPSSCAQIVATACADAGSRWKSGRAAVARADEEPRPGLDRQRRHRPQALARDPQAFTAGGEHRHARAVPHDLGHQLGGPVEHVLAVVEHEQQGPAAQVLDERLLDRQQRTLLHAQRRGDGVPDRAAVGERRELAQPAAVGEAVALAVGDLDREAGLADPADPGEGHQGRGPQRRPCTGHVVVPADQLGGRPRQVPGRAPGGEGGVVRQHLQVGLLGVLAGIDAELVGEVLPQRVVGRERVGGAAAAVQGVHEHHGRAFPGGVAARERLQFRDGVRGSAEPHQRFEAVLDGPRAQLVEPPGLGRGELEVGELGEGVAAPQRQPGVEPLQRGRVVVGRGGAPRRAEVLLEGGGVERGAVEREDVAGGLEAQPLPAPSAPRSREA